MSTLNTSNTKRILIVDDDKDLRELLDQYISRHHLDVFCADGGSEMDRLLKKHEFNLIILDLMMPEEDGLSILRRIRPHTHIPILILSAKGLDTERITGLEIGADDYMAKPFNPRELLARIRALLRRNHVQPDKPSNISLFGKNQFDCNKLELKQNNTVIPLTETESGILNLFVKNIDQTLSRDDIINMLYKKERDPFDRSIDIHITRLRKKIEADPSQPTFIQTIWGKGYKFTISQQ